MMLNCEMVVGLHLYQPPRRVMHEELSSIQTDPNNQNWTEIIDRQSYEPVIKSKAAENISFDAFGTLRQELKKIDPKTVEVMDQRLKTNGVADTFIHPILPDLSREDKEIVIGAGKESILKDTGIQLPFIWVPETALDYETLEVLSEFDYKGVICAPEQVKSFNGQSADSQPIKIDLNNGKTIYAIPFDRPVSSAIAFRDKSNADQFCQDFIRPAFNGSKRMIISYTDGETFGHHWKYGDKFLDYLVNISLPEQGINPVSINSLDLESMAIEGKLNNRSAWSCPHGDLIRWRGSCGCTQNGQWKESFYGACERLNERVTELVKEELRPNYKELIIKNFDQAFENKGIKYNKSALMMLVSAKVSALTSRTSCATFFDNPSVSGKISILFAVQSIAYIKDTGLNYRRAEKIGNEFYQNIISGLNDQQKKEMFDQKMLEILGVR
ncbi:MAG: hypothetical protein WCX20_00515 [Candidatus Shapirobacteria bacterium]